MSTTPYIDYHYLNYCSSADMDSTDDYSIAMLDMANSEFRDEYANSLPKNDQFFLYHDADTAVYDARFLDKIALQFPQYKHIIDTINPYDSKKIKETYNSILDYHRGQQATNAQGQQRHMSKKRLQRERIISVFEGSYDERAMKDEDEDDADVYEEGTYILSDGEQAMASADAGDQSEDMDEDDEDPEYIDKSYQRWLRTSARKSSQRHSTARGGKTRPGASGQSSSPYPKQPSPAMFDEEDRASDDNDLPALVPDVASSPELQCIATPTASPTATPKVRNAETNEKFVDLPVLPRSSAEKVTAGAGKSNVTLAGYSVTSDNLIVASWGSENGRSCRPLSSGNFECSCSHRTATMGDMTRHWMSKRHSDAAFMCKGCDKVYTRDDALKRHMRRSVECARRVRRSG